MTHARKKSDLAKVAMKPTIKAGLQTGAESVERRAGAKGNEDQQSMHRTQIRDCVSQVLGRVRQAAKERKRERCGALLHHVDVDLLRLSFHALKRQAAPGVDGVTWQDYEGDLESISGICREESTGAVCRGLERARQKHDREKPAAPSAAARPHGALHRTTSSLGLYRRPFERVAGRRRPPDVFDRCQTELSAQPAKRGSTGCRAGTHEDRCTCDCHTASCATFALRPRVVVVCVRGAGVLYFTVRSIAGRSTLWIPGMLSYCSRSSRSDDGESLSARRYRYTRRRTLHSSIRSGKYAPSASYEDGTY